jgi:hypothetical protein
LNLHRTVLETGRLTATTLRRDWLGRLGSNQCSWLRIMTNEQTNPPQTVPMPDWWPKYLQRVNESVSEAERHLEVPSGTISSIPTDPDFIATVKAYAVVEPLLNDLIVRWPTETLGLGLLLERENFRTFVTALNISGNTGKLKLAEGLGLLTDWQMPFVRALALVRNRYAHNVKNMHRSLAEILTDEQRSDQRIVEHLTGLRLTLPFDEDDLWVKRLMYYRLADFIALALNTLRPPPPQPGGLIGALLAGASTKSQVPDARDGD